MTPARTARGRFVSPKVMEERLAQLRLAGFSLSYAHRDDARRGWISSSSLTGEYYHGHLTYTVTGDPHPHYGDPYVSFDGVAGGEDSYGQTSTVVRSNFRSLKRDFPDFPWVETSFSNMNTLGCFVADLNDDMLAVLVGLSVEYPLFDESDHSDLEHEEIHASWGQFMAWEVRRELSEPCQSMWDSLGEEEVEYLWWASVSADLFGCYPEHNGVEVVWGSAKDRATDFREVVIRAYVTKVRHGSRLPSAWDWIPTLADRRRTERTIERLWQQFMGQDVTSHGVQGWDAFLASRGWKVTAEGAVFVGVKGN